MGNIAFNIEKFVDLNKQVNLDIVKNVNANVNNPDQLATAEADAEAFGPNALAEVDAYTVVTPPEGGEEGFTSGQVQVEGGAIPFAGTDPGADFTISFFDADDVNALDALFPLDGDPAPPADTPLPQPTLAIEDLDLSDGTLISSTPSISTYEYTSPGGFEIDFGTRSVDLNGDGLIGAGETGTLVLNSPENDVYEVLFNTDTGGVEVDLLVSDAAFTFTPSGGTPINVPADFDFVADSLGQLGGYEFEALADFPFAVPGDGGTAFAYAESTSALDLNPGGITPPPAA